MSGKFSSALMFVSLVAIVLAAHHANEENSRSASRDPASVMGDKEIILGSFRDEPTLAHTEKLRGPLQVRLFTEDVATPQIGEVFVLRGQVSSHKDLNDGFDFDWSLPEGVELVKGELNGHVSEISPDRPAVLEITLRKIAAGNRQIHLLANANRGDLHFAESAQFNTDWKRIDAQVDQDVKVFH